MMNYRVEFVFPDQVGKPNALARQNVVADSPESAIDQVRWSHAPYQIVCYRAVPVVTKDYDIGPNTFGGRTILTADACDRCHDLKMEHTIIENNEMTCLCGRCAGVH